MAPIAPRSDKSEPVVWNDRHQPALNDLPIYTHVELRDRRFGSSFTNRGISACPRKRMS